MSIEEIIDELWEERKHIDNFYYEDLKYITGKVMEEIRKETAKDIIEYRCKECRDHLNIKQCPGGECQWLRLKQKYKVEG